MNKNIWLPIKLILLILTLIIIGSIAILAINYSGFKKVTKVEGEEKKFSNVEKVVVESISLPVDIYESDVAQVTIKDNSKVFGLRTSNPNKVEQKGGVLYLEQAKGFSFLSFAIGNIVIEVPRDSILEYEINSVSGSINHDVISKDKMMVSSISGSIRIHQGGEKAIIKTTSGSVRIYSPFEEVSAKSVSGSIRIVANQDSKQVLSSSVSGSIRIQLENISGYDMDYSTVSGNVKDAYKNINYSKSGESKSGDSFLEIKATSVSGSIKLEDWDN